MLLDRKSLIFQKDFFLFWLGQATSQLGDGLNRVALLWFVYKLTGSASSMAVIGILQTLPVLCVSLLAGPYLDRVNKKYAMIYIDLYRFILMMSIPILYHLHVLNFIVLCGLVLFISCFSVLFGPALTSAIPFMVHKDRYKEANGLMQATAQLGMIFGPALSGLLIPILSAPNILFIDAVTFLISAICIIPLKYNQQELIAKKINLKADIKEGINFITHNKTVLNTIFLMFIFNFFITSLPIIYSYLSKNILEQGSFGVGFLMTGFGIGALIASIINGYVRIKFTEQRMIQVLLLVIGFSFVLISKLFFLRYALFISVLMGICAATISITYVTLIQTETPKSILSRVFTSSAMLIHVATIVGMFFTGFMLDHKGIIYTLFMFGFIVIMFTVALALKYEIFANKLQILNDIKQLYNFIKNKAYDFVRYLNAHGFDIYIMNDDEYEESKASVKSIRFNFGYKLLLQAIVNEIEEDRTGFIMGISFVLFVIVICLI